jgi:hypothetical protein
MKSMYGTRQAAQQWHKLISTLFEGHGCEEVNSEKAIFMNSENYQWIMPGLFVSDIIYASSSETLKLQFIVEYKLKLKTHVSLYQSKSP